MFDKLHHLESGWFPWKLDVWTNHYLGRHLGKCSEMMEENQTIFTHLLWWKWWAIIYASVASAENCAAKLQSEILCVTVSGKYSRLRICVNWMTRIPSQAAFPILQNSLRKSQESLFPCPPASGYLGSEFESRPMEVYSFYSRLVGWCLEQLGCPWTTQEMATRSGFCGDLPCRMLKKGTRFWWRRLNHEIRCRAGFFSRSMEPFWMFSLLPVIIHN